MNEFLISTEISDTEMIEGCIASYSYDDNDIRRGTQHVMLLALELTHPNTNLRSMRRYVSFTSITRGDIQETFEEHMSAAIEEETYRDNEDEMWDTFYDNINEFSIQRFSNSNEDDDSENDSSSDSSSHAGAHDYDHQKDRSDDDEGENDGGDE
ncbi:hypothetical protein Tco_1159750, partial [Tanacetum coccineum]